MLFANMTCILLNWVLKKYNFQSFFHAHFFTPQDKIKGNNDKSK